MARLSAPLVVSVAILCVFGIRSLIGLPMAFVVHDYGEFTQSAHIGGVIGALTGIFLCFALAYGHWRSRGRWGLGIGIFAVVLVIMQSFLMYLAVSSGRVALDTTAIAKFIFFTLVGGLGLAVSSFISYRQRSKENA
jgi:hypothetical protein